MCMFYSIWAQVISSTEYDQIVLKMALKNKGAGGNDVRVFGYGFRLLLAVFMLNTMIWRLSF